MGRLAALSVAALRHGQELREVPLPALAARLYAWNRLPASAEARAGAQLALAHQHARVAAGRKWTETAAGPGAPWRFWRPRAPAAIPAAGAWKLYVSPHPSMLAEAVRATFGALEGLPVLGLKYAADAANMLRPDKLVLHVATEAAVRAAAARLARSLAACPAQGVPFTAELGGDGLLSYGRDPPPGSAAFDLGPSWRAWLTVLLAGALRGAGDPGREPWQLALQAAAASGVDPVTWAPAADIWSRACPATVRGEAA